MRNTFLLFALCILTFVFGVALLISVSHQDSVFESEQKQDIASIKKEIEMLDNKATPKVDSLTQPELSQNTPLPTLEYEKTKRAVLTFERIGKEVTA